MRTYKLCSDMWSVQPSGLTFQAKDNLHAVAHLHQHKNHVKPGGTIILYKVDKLKRMHIIDTYYRKD